MDNHQCSREPVREPGEFETVHIIKFSEKAKNLKVQYAATKKEQKVKTYCNATPCNVHLHILPDKNCFERWHSKDFPHPK